MNKSPRDFIILKGVVIELLKGNYFKIKLDNGYLVKAKADNQFKIILDGKAKKPRIFERDKVKVKVPLSDLVNLTSNSALGIIVGLI